MGYNSQAFTPEEVKKGLHLDLIKYLIDYNMKSKDFFNEIHITNDGFCTIVNWLHDSYTEKVEEFRYISYDEEVMIRVELPDKSYQYVFTKEEAKETLDDWLKEHPSWKQNEYGNWYNTEEVSYVKDDSVWQ